MRLIDLLANMRIELHEMLDFQQRSELRAKTNVRLMRSLYVALVITGRVYATH